MNITAALSYAKQCLQVSSDSAVVDAELLLAHVLDVKRVYLRTWPEQILTIAQQQKYRQLITERTRGMPVSYLLGSQPFWTLALAVTAQTLIPRPETELLVELSLELIDPTVAEIADLGTGSGAIALSLAKERPQCLVTATDISKQALQIAKQNAKAHNLPNVQFFVGDCCAALPHHSYAAIISNPPYIAADDPHLLKGDLRFEPQGALVAENDGLQILATITQQVPDYLLPGGWLLLEHGNRQAKQVRELLARQGFSNINTHQDFNQQDRVTTAQFCQPK